ncbi:GroES-like protein [Daldinia caldariorum]|uniref:GroES-like protein n=1 Tax=Daldinia caldariorum TaxID=326644 RepID=UPI00200840EE|nr:GroES-like protein [Daldinia caldariorum]KAI1467588.1 GroES-like protein [Daldinia caldariorum]
MSSITFTVFKGDKSGVPKKATTTKPKQLSGDSVLVRITASGLCGTDLHFKHEDMVLGHEGIGVVEETGPGCIFLKKGDRVGWGYEHDSCGHCEQCLSGKETYCARRVMYGEANRDQGSFATHAIWKEAFLFKIPDELSDEDAAPMQCGGATVFNALHAYSTMGTETVGIMGVGGLGHLAIQFAAKMGCRVVVLSGTDSKKEEAMRLGAHEFIATKTTKDLKVSHPLNRLLVCTSAQPNWRQLTPILAPGAFIHPLSVDLHGDFNIPYWDLLTNGVTIQGSVIASRYIHKRMLDFAALHKIKPVVQIFPMTEAGIKEAMEKLDQGKVHFRAVFKPGKELYAEQVVRS